METLLLVMAFIIFLYTVAVVTTVTYDLATGRYKRLQDLRNNVNKTGEMHSRSSK